MNDMARAVRWKGFLIVFVSLLRIWYILNALQKLLALDLVPSKVGGCFPRKLVLSSIRVVMVAWTVAGWVDMVVVCTWIGMTDIGWIIGGGWDVIGDDNDAGLLIVPWSRLWIPLLKVMPAWSGSPRGWMGGGMVEGLGSLAGGSPLCNPPHPLGRSSFGLVKYCLRASFQFKLYQQ